MGGLLDLLTGASKARTEAVVEEKKASLVEVTAETPPVVEADSIEVIQAAQS